MSFPHLTPYFIDGFDVANWTSVINTIQLKYPDGAQTHQGAMIVGYDGVGQAMQEGNGGSFITSLSRATPSSNDTYLLNLHLRVDAANIAACNEYFFSFNNGFAGASFNFPPNSAPLALVLLPGMTGNTCLRLWKNVTNPVYFPAGTNPTDYTELWVSSPLIGDTWYKIQLKFTYSTGAVELIFGVQGTPSTTVYSGSSSFTKAFSQFTFYGGGAAGSFGWAVDDFVLFTSDDGTGTFPSDEIIVTTVSMNASGVNNWIRNTNTFGSNNFNCINEFPGDGTGRDDPDGDNSYVVSTGNNEESYLTNVSVIPNVGAIALNAAWKSNSGTSSIVASDNGSQVGSPIVGVANAVRFNSSSSYQYYVIDQWIEDGPVGNDNYGVIQTSGSSCNMSQFYLEALQYIGLSSTTDQTYSAQFTITGNTLTNDTYTAQFSIAENTPPTPPTPTAPSVTCNPNGPLSIGGSE